MNDWVKDVPVGTTVLCRTDGLREAFTRLADEWAASSCSGLVEEIRTLLAAHPAPETDGHVCTPHCDADQGHYPAPTPDTRREDVARAIDPEAFYDGPPGDWSPRDLIKHGNEIRQRRTLALQAADRVLAVLPAPPVVDEAEVRERIAQEIEASILPNDDSPAADWLRTRAARIARGATSG